MPGIKFSPRWREELVATSEEGTLVFELTMGTYHVYFPSKTIWKNSVPGWALPQWETYFEACKEWCERNNIPMSIVENGLVYEEKHIR
jgi:hypothetical protein